MDEFDRQKKRREYILNWLNEHNKDNENINFLEAEFDWGNSFAFACDFKSNIRVAFKTLDAKNPELKTLNWSAEDFDREFKKGIATRLRELADKLDNKMTNKKGHRGISPTAAIKSKER